MEMLSTLSPMCLLMEDSTNLMACKKDPFASVSAVKKLGCLWPVNKFRKELKSMQVVKLDSTFLH